MAEVDAALRALVADVDAAIFDVDDATFSARIVATIDRSTVPTPAVRRGRRRRAIAIAIIGVLVGGGVATPAVADWVRMRIGGVEIQRRDVPAGSRLGSGLELGRRVTLAEARQEVPFVVRRIDAIATAPEVWVDTSGTIPVVSLVYPSAPKLPVTRAGVGLLLQEFAAPLGSNSVMTKFAGPDTAVEPVTVGGARGAWLQGAHGIGLLSRGDLTFVENRLAANALVWEEGGVTYRIEAAVGKQAALEFARSMR
jgi:hypothetical protein